MQDFDKEIEELEKEIFGTQNEEETQGAEGQGDEKVESTTTPTPEVKPEKPTEDWEKRYKGYKASTDVTIRDLRNELAAYRTKYATLQKDYVALDTKLRNIELDSIKTFSEEDIDILGEPAVNALDKSMKKILETKLKPLETELERTRNALHEQELKAADNNLKADYDRFLEQIGKAVPDFYEVNVSRGFIDYMKSPDEYSGIPREYLFKKAEENLDAGRIISFFKDYKKTVVAPENILEKAITPTGSPGSTVTEVKGDKEQVITYGFIDKFYDDLTKGVYKTKTGREKAAKIEAMIDKAVLEGRVQ